MMRSRLRFAVRGIVLGALVAVPVFADAPKGQYPNFTGQDQRIRDLKTGLVWERSVSPAPVTFATAEAGCTGGTRLPTLKELLTLVDEEPDDYYDLNLNRTVLRFIDAQAFGQTPVDKGYWTASRDGTSVWTVDFATAETRTAEVGDTRYVRCVRFVP
ncbi:MAG: DUF1566 domain-containing protein [Labilithrix sp.]|nr:DUF1566 domain-containing protein [Labilithrix sp.]